jgi:hypothetical protein
VVVFVGVGLGAGIWKVSLLPQIVL